MMILMVYLKHNKRRVNMKKLINILLICLTIYLLSSFVYLNLNIFEWSESGRVIMAIIIGVSLFVFMIISTIED